ncbi:MAG: DNA primase [Nocardioidaceae bacterium]|nr:DNA primase [Nocardioidaceae bacterium]
MAGRIREDDIAAVRERAHIDEVISQHVTLRPAGGGSLKGLCPFHDEKSPSLSVTPSRGYYHCFGCQAGGDVFTFLQQIEGLSFTEAVERLAGRYGVQLRFAEGGSAPTQQRGQRSRLVEANSLAAEFYASALADSAEAAPGRQFLSDRGFDKDAAERFGIGFAARSGEALLRHLRQKGFRDDELVTAGLVASGTRGAYDRFRGRLLWPIRELSGDVVGFGARRLFDDDRVEAKYLNTPDTPLYKKSHVLYGVDLARRNISSGSQAVVVEGYTDVMACHESGVGTAVATCGTAFGDDHARLLRRLLLDHDEFRGEIIFTFDGDDAGQRAAMRAFQGDAQFVAQTYVAVEPEGLDPCDLRLSKGDAAVRELVARRVPLYRFVLRNVLSRYDLDRADQRVDAVRDAARLVASVRDRSKVNAFTRELTGLVGVDIDEVRAEVRRASSRRPRGQPTTSSAPRTGNGSAPVAPDVPDVRDAHFADEWEALKAVVQYPHLVDVSGLDAGDFTHPTLSALWSAVTAVPLPTAPDPRWWQSLTTDADEPETARLIAGLAVEPMRTVTEPDDRLVSALLARVQELTAQRQVEALKSRLQRTNPIEQVSDYNRMFGELVALEQRRRALRDRAIGGGVA